MRYNRYSLLYDANNHKYATLLTTQVNWRDRNKVVTTLPPDTIQLTPTLYLADTARHSPPSSYKYVDCWIAESDVIFNATVLEFHHVSWYIDPAIAFHKYVAANVSGYTTLETLQSTYNIK